MILERLRDFHARIPDDAQVPEGYKEQPVDWVLDVSADGRVLGLSETGESKKKRLKLATPYVGRSGVSPPPYLLIDKPDYVLGLAEDDATDIIAKRTKERHDAYLKLLDAAITDTGDEALTTLVKALRDEEQIDHARAALAEKPWKSGDLIVPRVADEFLHRRPSVRRFWQSRLTDKAAGKSGMTAECLLCAEEKPIARTHPVELLVGPDRTKLVTGNASAFLSHGLEQSEIAPLCLDCARTYGEALRHLLTDPNHHLRLSDATWLFWTREPAPGFAFVSLFSDPTEEDVKRLLRAPQRGQQPDLDANDFYALVVSSNKSRLVVRSWLTLSLGEVQQNLGRYFERQRIAGYDGTSPPLKLLALAGATVRDLKDLPSQTTEALLAHAITGRPLPVGVLHRAVQRAKADDHPMTRPRAGLFKLYLTQHDNAMLDPILNEDHPEPAYHCGRLLAVLDQIQRKVMKANTTLVDRFYGSASTTPAVVFGTLMTKAQPHLAKLRKSRSDGRDDYLDRRLGQIAQRIPSFPKTLTPEQQALFGLGFYQEKYRPYEKADAGDDTAQPDS